ncbi:DMT family transporter [Rhodoferax sp.]|uniref:DMT family transporter n=1 Tax=Rhodoferax sp. TaxID=50421 RepID=UPI0026038060|nr:DMT family transporter [Rhodoferax sp.]MDD2809348.1 DMT family transporter [Rhodoferax sp.]MDD5480743.1 DMT family transporter [Rhodoferax sp.]
MHAPITLKTAALLTLPPLLWAGNAVVGRVVAPLVSPMTLNFLRWSIAFAFLLPLAAPVLRRGSALWPSWRRFVVLALLAIGGYNALLYLSLNTSTPINVTLVGSSTPVWMLLIGRVFFGTPISVKQWLGAVLSIAGVMVVLSRGELAVLLQVRLVAGDVYMLLASAAWAYYSWMLVHPTTEPPEIKRDWSAFLLAQIAFGLVWSGLFAGSEWALGLGRLALSWPVAAALLFISLGPALLAYRSWGAGVSRAGPSMAGFFINLTPLFTAVLSSAFLGEVPHLYHAVAFVLIVGGIAVSSRR